jgi:hypothetical protein
MLFLRYLDDLEQVRAMKAELVGKDYEFIIDVHSVYVIPWIRDIKVPTSSDNCMNV